MKVDKETVKKVLALFDPEDIPYIQSDSLLVLLEPDESTSSEQTDKPKVKGLGEKNGRRGK